MIKKTDIPEIKFKDRQKKNFEFELIYTNRNLKAVFPKQHKPYRPHRLSFYTILFIIDGEGQHFIDFKPYDYKKGSLIFLSKEQVHAFQENEGREAYFLLFTEHFLEKNPGNSNLIQQLSIYNYHLYEPVIHLSEEQFHQLHNIARTIKKEYDDPDDFATEDIIQSYLRIFLFQAERIRKQHLEKQTKPYYYEEFGHFQSLLQQHIFENRQVAYYAEKLGFSTKKLNRITQEVVQMPAKTYINDMLILEMKRFLMNTALSIKEIAYKTGFESPTNFVKFFRKNESITPAAFRKQY